MIDEKKIEEASHDYAWNNLTLEGGEEEMLDTERAFESGINWFKENLWHDASEKPNFDKDCLVELEIPNPKTGAFEIKAYAVSQYDCTLDPFDWYGEDIDNLLVEEYGKITRWLYIEDLMKGGK